MKGGSGRLRLAVEFAAHHHGPQDAGHLVGQRNGGELSRPSRQQLDQPGRGAPGLGKLDHRGGAEHQEPAQACVTLSTDPAWPGPAAGRILPRGYPEPGGEVARRTKRPGVGDLEREADCADRTDARLRRQRLADRVLFVPGQQLDLDDLELVVIDIMGWESFAKFKEDTGVKGGDLLGKWWTVSRNRVDILD